MTIAAGFCYDGGVLVCADTLYSGGYGQNIHQSKIVPFEYDGGFAVFALAGHQGYAKAAIQKIQSAIRKINGPVISEDVTIACENALLSVYSQHIDNRPESLRPELHISLLVANWSATDGLHLYASRQTAMIEIDQFECIGNGAYLAHYIVSPTYEAGASSQLMRYAWRPPKRDVVILALEVMAAVKQHEPSCGGRSEMIALSGDGKRTPLGYHHLDRELANAEQFAGSFHNGFRRLLSAAADPSVSDADLKAMAEGHATAAVKDARFRWKVASKWGLTALTGDVFPEGEEEDN